MKDEKLEERISLLNALRKDYCMKKGNALAGSVHFLIMEISKLQLEIEELKNRTFGE